MCTSKIQLTGKTSRKVLLISRFKTHPKSTHVTKLSEAVGKSESLVSAVQSHSLTFRKSPGGQKKIIVMHGGLFSKVITSFYIYPTGIFSNLDLFAIIFGNNAYIINDVSSNSNLP